MKSFLKDWLSYFFMLAGSVIAVLLILLSASSVILIPYVLERYVGFGWAMTIAVVLIVGLYSFVITIFERKKK